MMPVDMDRLLEQEMLMLTPAASRFDTGRFDTGAVAAGLAGIGFPFQDDEKPSRFLICSDEESRQHFQAALRADPMGRYPRVVRVDVGADRLLVWPASYHPALREVSRQVLEWLITLSNATIVNEDDVDMADSPAAK